MIRPVAQATFDALMMDTLPSPAGLVDFGLDTTEHLRVMQNMIRAGELTAEEMDALLGNGPAITQRANALHRNPNGIVFKTAWDDMPPAEE